MPRGELSAKEESAGDIVVKHLGGTYEARDVRGRPTRRMTSMVCSQAAAGRRWR
jgi:hypothetical protein